MVSTSKLYSFLYILEHYSFKMFCALSPYFDREPSPFMYFVYLSGVRCFSPSPKKTHIRALILPRLLLLWDYLIFFVNRVYEFPFVRLFLTRCRLFQSILALLFFLRFWLMLEAASPWFGTKFSRLWCCLPRRWFAVNSPCSSWFSRSDFWWSNIYALFHNSRTVPWFADFVSPPLPSYPFHYVCQSKFG